MATTNRSDLYESGYDLPTYLTAPVCARCSRLYCYCGAPRVSQFDPPKRFTLDGEPIDSLDEFLMLNDFDSETVGLIWTMEKGESLVLGGGAGAEFTFARVE